MDVMPPQIPADRLKAMLGGAKNLMKKVESGDYSSGNIDPTAMVYAEQLVEANAVPQQYVQQPTYSNQQYSREEIFAKSKVPDIIKEAMKDSPPLPSYNPYHTFNVEDVPELLEKPINQQQYRKPVRENIQPNQQIPAGMIMVNEAQLKQMMQDFMFEFMTNTFTKNLSEETIKRTISTLIKEGKITVKQQSVIKK